VAFFVPAVLSLAALGLGVWARKAGGHAIGITLVVAASVVIVLTWSRSRRSTTTRSSR